MKGERKTVVVRAFMVRILIEGEPRRCVNKEGVSIKVEVILVTRNVNIARLGTF